MRALRGFLIVAVVAGVFSGAAGFVVMAFQPPTVTVAALRETPKVAPGVQASRPALPVDKAKTAARVEKDQANLNIAATGVDDATPQVTQDQGNHARTVRSGERSHRESPRRTDGYTTEARWSSNLPRLHGPE